MNRYIHPTLMYLRPRRHIITTKSLRILHDMSLTALRNDYDPKTGVVRTPDLNWGPHSWGEPRPKLRTNAARCKRHTWDLRLGIVFLYESLQVVSGLLLSYAWALAWNVNWIPFLCFLAASSTVHILACECERWITWTLVSFNCANCMSHAILVTRGKCIPF